MKRLRALWNTTAIRLSIIYLAVLGIMALAIISYMTGSTIKILRNQFETSINVEVQELSEVYQTGGINRLVRAMERRALAPGANLYIVTDLAGVIIAGNVFNLQTGVMDKLGWTHRPFGYSRFSDRNKDNKKFRNHAIARVFELPNGIRVLIGRDIGERESFRKVVTRALVFSLVSMLMLGFLTWMFVGRRALKRIDLVSQSTNRILAGDRTERLPLSGGKDEFDRLSAGLNSMLDRIDKLDDGLKQVSDNIAHDLKTPITRLRNRVDTTLRGRGNLKAYRETLSNVGEECEQLIRTFDALLMISRVESGSATATFSSVDLSSIVEDMSELYIPLAEDDGFEIETQFDPEIRIQGNRELLGQAIANLLDNAMKYAGTNGEKTPRIGLYLKKGKNSASIIVSDNGPGIPEKQRDYVLQRFTRLEESRTMQGNGLGLSLVKAVVQLHGGTLKLEDNRPGLKVTIKMDGIGS